MFKLALLPERFRHPVWVCAVICVVKLHQRSYDLFSFLTISAVHWSYTYFISCTDDRHTEVLFLYRALMHMRMPVELLSPAEYHSFTSQCPWIWYAVSDTSARPRHKCLIWLPSGGELDNLVWVCAEMCVVKLHQRTYDLNCLLTIMAVH